LGTTKQKTFFALAVVSAIGSLVAFIAGVSGGFSGGSSTHGEGGSGYFIGALLAMLLTGVFTYLGLSARPSEP
jgi:hypothetical protein